MKYIHVFFLYIFFLCTFPPIAFAENWVSVTSVNDTDFFIDTDSIRFCDVGTDHAGFVFRTKSYYSEEKARAIGMDFYCHTSIQYAQCVLNMRYCTYAWQFDLHGNIRHLNRQFYNQSNSFILGINEQTYFKPVDKGTVLSLICNKATSYAYEHFEQLKAFPYYDSASDSYKPIPAELSSMHLNTKN